MERVFNLKRTIDHKNKKYIEMEEKMVAAVDNELSTKVKVAMDLIEANNKAKRAKRSKLDANAAKFQADTAEVSEQTTKCKQKKPSIKMISRIERKSKNMQRGLSEKQKS